MRIAAIVRSIKVRQGIRWVPAQFSRGRA